MQDGLPARHVTCVFKDSRDYLWVGTSAGLAKFNGARFEQIGLPGARPEKVLRIREDAEGAIWFLTTGGIGRYDGASAEFFPKSGNRYAGIPDQDQEEALKAHTNGWVCKSDPEKGTIFVLNKKNKVETELRLGISLTCADAPQNVLEEADFYWIATKEGLVQVFRRGFRQIRHPELTYVWGGAEDLEGNMIFSNYDGQLIRYTDTSCQALSKAANWYFYFHPARNGTGDLYFPEARGLIKLSGKDLKRITPADAEGGPLTRLFAAYDSIDHMILAPGQGGKLWLVDRFDQVQIIHNEKGNHRKRALHCAIRDQRNNYWMGGLAGLSRYSIPEKKIYYYLPEEERLPLASVLCMAMEKSGRLWLGGEDGLGYWDYSGDSLALIGPAEIFTQSIKQITVVNDKYLVIGAIRGVYMLDLEVFNKTGKTAFVRYNRQNGFMGIEPVQSGAFLDSKGRLWLISSNQVSYIPVADIRVKPILAAVRITEINGRKLAWGTEAQEIKLPRNAEAVSLRFEAIGYQRPAPVRYAWKLEGGNRGFSEWNFKDSASFSELKPGTHRIVVKAFDPAKATLEAMPAATVTVRVRQDFWRHPDFYLIAIVVIFSLAIVAGVFIYLARKAKELATEKERLLNYYQVHALQAQLKPHFIFNLLATVANQINKDRKEDALRHIRQMETLLRNFLESSVGGNILDTYGEHGQVPLAQEMELLNMYVQLVQAQAPDTFEFEMEIDPVLDPGNERVPPMIIQPFVENAIKHGLFLKTEKPGHLWVRFIPFAGGVKCRVEDDGVGRDYAMKAARQDPGRPASRGTSLVRQRVALLNKLGAQIALDIRDRPGGGTIVEIAFV